MTLFTCPICGALLQKDEKRYYCVQKHSFDISSDGYVHLLPANKKKSLIPGDNKAMASARNRFLNGDWYRALGDKIAELADRYVDEQAVIFDSGCGEGYYTEKMEKRLKASGKNVHVFGIDISKFSLRWAAKRSKDIQFAVASAYHLPIPNQSVDLLLNCFSPLAIDEFRRVIKPGGYFLYIVPAPKHMWELKAQIYETPYENKEQMIDYEGFEYVEVVRVDDIAHFSENQPISDLFGMTPYFWKTPKEGSERVKHLDHLDMQISFDLHLFKRMPDIL